AVPGRLRPAPDLRHDAPPHGRHPAAPDQRSQHPGHPGPLPEPPAAVTRPMSKGLVLHAEAWSTTPFAVNGQAPWAAGGWSASVWRQAATVSGSMAARLANMRSGSAKVWQHITY